jgi:hypothetical protein
LSAWRRLALDRFPHLQSEINSAADAAHLWRILHAELLRAYAHIEPATIRAIHDYGAWTLTESQSPSLTAAAMSECYSRLIDESWTADSPELRRPALDLALYWAPDLLTRIYWTYFHSLLPKHQQREFIAELAIGKPPRD